jgi:hypothetical protein
MKSLAAIPRIVIDLGTTFDVRSAIELPWRLARLPTAATVALDFRHVRSLHEASLLALLPALASVKNRLVKLIGLEHAVIDRAPSREQPA